MNLNFLIDSYMKFISVWESNNNLLSRVFPFAAFPVFWQ